MLVGDAVTVAVDGASLLAGMATLGTAIGGGVLGAVKLMINYMIRQDSKRELVVKTLVESTNKNTEALTRLAERVSGCPHRTPQPNEGGSKEMLRLETPRPHG